MDGYSQLLQSENTVERRLPGFKTRGIKISATSLWVFWQKLSLSNDTHVRRRKIGQRK